MQLVTPRQFCRVYFGLDSLPEEAIQKEEKSHGYKTKCSIALAHVLGMSSLTLRNIRYGKGIDFEGLTDQARLILTFWIVERRYQQEISHLKKCVQSLELQLRQRTAA